MGTAAVDEGAIEGLLEAIELLQQRRAGAGAVDRRERKKLANRDAIRAAGLRLFFEKGYANTSLKDITDAADVGLRTFYRHFEAKEDLLLVEVRQFLVDAEAVLDTCPPDLAAMDCLFRVVDELEPRWTIGPASSGGLASSLRLMYNLGVQEPDVEARFLWLLAQHYDHDLHFFARRLGVGSDTLEPRLYAYLSQISYRGALNLFATGRDAENLFATSEQILVRFGQGLDPEAVARRHRSRPAR